MSKNYVLWVVKQVILLGHVRADFIAVGWVRVSY